MTQERFWIAKPTILAFSRDLLFWASVNATLAVSEPPNVIQSNENAMTRGADGGRIVAKRGVP